MRWSAPATAQLKEMATPTACEEWEDDSVPSYVPITRTHSAGWQGNPSSSLHRGRDPIPQDFSLVGILEAQHGAKLIHQQSLTVILYNLLKTQNTFDLNIIAQNDLAKMICDFQREDSRWTFLMQAAYWDNENVARWLLQQGADPFVKNASNQNALDVALNERNMKVAEILRLRISELTSAKKTKPIDITSSIKEQQSR